MRLRAEERGGARPAASSPVAGGREETRGKGIDGSGSVCLRSAETGPLPIIPSLHNMIYLVSWCFGPTQSEDYITAGHEHQSTSQLLCAQVT